MMHLTFNSNDFLGVPLAKGINLNIVISDLIKEGHWDITQSLSEWFLFLSTVIHHTLALNDNHINLLIQNHNDSGVLSLKNAYIFK